MPDFIAAIDELCNIAQTLDNDRLLNTGKFLKQRILNPECYVVCLGETSSGKSTIINSLIGEGILPVSALPTTGAISEVCFDRDIFDKSFYAINKNATMEKISRDTFIKLAKQPDEELERIRICVPADESMSGVRLFDTPGYGSLVEQHEEILMDFLPQCDSVIYVVSYKIGIQDADYEFLETLSTLIKERDKLPFCLVINRCPKDIGEDDRRIKEIKQYVLGLLGLIDVPTVMVSTYDVQKKALDEHSSEKIKQFIADCFKSEESKNQLQNDLKISILDYCEMIKGDLEKKITIAQLDEDEREIAASIYQKYVDDINVAINDIVVPGFDDLIRRFPKQVDYCSDELERECVEAIKAQKRLEKEETNVFIKEFLLKNNGQKQAKELQLFIQTEIEAIDRKVNNYINEAVVRIDNDLRIKNVGEATRTAFGILTDVTGKGIERGLIGYCAKFGGQGGTRAGMANLASHTLKKIGDAFGKTFSRETHNALKHTMAKLGLTSTKAISCAVAIFIDTLVYVVDLATWKAMLIGSIKKVVKKWNKDVKEVTLADLIQLKKVNIDNLKEIIDIAENEFPTYTEDSKDMLNKYRAFVDRIEIIKGECTYE